MLEDPKNPYAVNSLFVLTFVEVVFKMFNLIFKFGFVKMPPRSPVLHTLADRKVCQIEIL